MNVARQLKQENIIEYLLYMWQIEDLLRAYQLDNQLILKNLTQKYTVENKKEVEAWYLGLAQQMKEEHLKEKGHLQFIINKINDLNDLHLYLIKEQKQDYLQVYSWAKTHIDELLKLTKNSVTNEIEASLNGLYGYLLLKYQKREISKETQASVEKISKMLALLNRYYLRIENGEMEVE